MRLAEEAEIYALKLHIQALRFVDFDLSRVLSAEKEVGMGVAFSSKQEVTSRRPRLAAAPPTARDAQRGGCGGGESQKVLS